MRIDVGEKIKITGEMTSNRAATIKVVREGGYILRISWIDEAFVIFDADRGEDYILAVPPILGNGWLQAWLNDHPGHELVGRLHDILEAAGQD